MSIANISSEDRVSGNDANFEINLKRPIQRAIGLQLLNATIPLTYNIINTDDNVFQLRRQSNSSIVYGGALDLGTYTDMDDLCRELERKVNGYLGTPTRRNESQRRFCIDNRMLTFTVDTERESDQDVTNDTLDTLSGLAYDDLEPGFIIDHIKVVGQPSAQYYIESIAKSASEDYVATLIPAIEGDPVVSTLNDAGLTTTVTYPGALVFPDRDSQQVIIASDDPAMDDIQPLSSNSTRMNKTFGFDGSEIADTYSGKYANFDRVLKGNDHPEPIGPSLLYLRIGGDALLDQQNSDTSMNDRIPIPLGEAHGGVVHYEHDSETDVIPFSVPCDISRIKFTLEYGDENKTVGGETQNLRGHHTYYRLKFYKQHQQKKTHI